MIHAEGKDKWIPVTKRTRKAKLFKVPYRMGSFHIARTLDGFIDLAVPHGYNTFQLNRRKTKALIAALECAIADLKAGKEGQK